MYKTSVYTLVNSNIEELAHQKRQKSQKVIFPSSHWLCINVLLNNINNNIILRQQCTIYCQ